MTMIPIPSERFKPRIFIDGDQWCVLYGEDLQDGVAGFGKSPHQAMLDFDRNWFKELPQKKKTLSDKFDSTIYVPAEATEGERKFINRVIEKLKQFPIFKPYMAQAVGRAIFDVMQEVERAE